MFFKKGDKVVCIDDKKTHPLTDKHFVNWITEGMVYIVRATSLDLEGKQGILLQEVTNPKIYSTILGGYFEPRFNSIRFRKLEEIEEEVSLEKELELAM